MTHQELTNYVHEMTFTLRCHELEGIEFQHFFEKIMLKHDPSFTPVKPHGREGDWKNDGWISHSGTLFQSYAPENLEITKVLKKIREDFDGALAKWTGKMKEWTFVYPDKGKLPAMVLSLIEDLRSSHPELAIDTWNRERLWGVVRNLSLTDRNAILGAVPSVSEVRGTSSAEIQALLKFLARSGNAIEDAGTGLLDLADKLDRNGLGSAIRQIVVPSLPVARTVADYLKRHPDPEFNAIISNTIAGHYAALTKEMPDRPEEVFFGLIRWVESGAPQSTPHPGYFWAAVGIVSHYFELCDIFES